jgi:hypothetical protein
MKKINLIITAFCIVLFFQASAQITAPKKDKILGMYMHQHWSYNHPYAVRTWTLEDWRGYIDGIKRLGYNYVLIWPMLEIMPDPLTPSDEANIAKIAKVIDLVHNDFSMKVSIVLCPNVSPKSEEGRKYTFEKRPFFHTDDRVDPGDPIAFGKLIEWREKLFRPLAKADGLFIIDSDPGGYPNSTNAEFTYILGAHRRMLDRLRPGIEVYYWAHFGWEAYSKFYATGVLVKGEPREPLEVMGLLGKDKRSEPWGVASSGFGADFANDVKMGDRVLTFPYGAIEGEPSFPLTIYGGVRATNGGKKIGKRGVLGNAQTHAVQLPNTFAFARAAQGLSVEKVDYIAFANELLPGNGESIVEAWDALQGEDVARMNAVIKKLSPLQKATLKTGPLKGLLFGDGSRFIDDLILQLRLTATMNEFRSVINTQANNTSNVKASLAALTAASDAWQQKHGYSNHWSWPPMQEALRKLNAAPVTETLNTLTWLSDEGDTPFERVKNGLARLEDYSPRLIASMKKALAEMDPKAKQK